MTNLTSVPVGLVREQTAGEILFQNLNSPAAIGLLILIVVVAIMVGMVMARKEEDDWDDLDDEVPPPPPWAPDEWPEGAGPPPEILTQSESTLEEE
jgi:hypothetical protein